MEIRNKFFELSNEEIQLVDGGLTLWQGVQGVILATYVVQVMPILVNVLPVIGLVNAYNNGYNDVMSGK